MAKGAYKKKSPRSGSRRYWREERKVQAALLLLLILPIVLLVPGRIHSLTHPERWGTAVIEFTETRYRTGKGVDWYDLVDASGTVWRLPEELDMERFQTAVQPGTELRVTFDPEWDNGRHIRAIEGFLDRETAEENAREQAKSETALFVCALTVSLALAGYMIVQLVKARR